MSQRPIIVLLGLSALALSRPPHLSAQTDDARWLKECQADHSGSDDREQFCEVRHAGFKPSGGMLTVDPDENGGAEIVGWDRDSVAVTMRIQAGAGTDEDAQALAKGITLKAAGSTVQVDGPSSGRHQHWSVELVVMVPKQSGLAVRTMNGPLSVEGVSGRMDLRAQNGPVSLARLAGDVQARAQNGPLTVTLSGTTWDGKGLDAETVNGPVTLALPEGYNAELETGTVNGPMNLEMPLTVTLNGSVRDRINTTLGKGGSTVRVVTTNGPITIRKARS
jgi:DUF4097 and DUF4098 domain-containing protein YvlB